MIEDIIIDKKFKGLIKQADGNYVFVGNIVTEGSLEVTLDTSLTVVGYIIVGKTIKANNTIILTDKISAGKDIDIVHGGIKSDNVILASGGINVGTYIMSSGSIIVGKDIHANYIKADHNITVYGEVIAISGISAGDNITIKKNVMTRGRLTAGGDIRVSGSIACKGIIAGGAISANSYISAKHRIFAGVSVNNTSFDEKCTVTCSQLRNGEITHGKLVLLNKEY